MNANTHMFEMGASTHSEFYNNLSTYERKYAPSQLFLCGDSSLLLGDYRRISIVGSRQVSLIGLEHTRLVSEACVNNSCVVVSGLAEGVDTVAHETAMRHGGKTIAVLGTPLNEAYPRKNATLLDEIKSKHLAVSQFPIGSKVFKGNFPIRNRLMALLSDATVIIEAGPKSGTVHQGWEALRIGRLLFIAQDVYDNPSNSWARDMKQYGAQVLSIQEIVEVVGFIPSYTSGKRVLL